MVPAARPMRLEISPRNSPEDRRKEREMELRDVDPRLLKDDPANPRHIPAGPVADDQLTANIRAVGIVQPPVVRPDGEDLLIVAGRRRVRCAIAASLDL